MVDRETEERMAEVFADNMRLVRFRRTMGVAAHVLVIITWSILAWFIFSYGLAAANLLAKGSEVLLLAATPAI
jgi:hypothetical protein